MHPVFAWPVLCAPASPPSLGALLPGHVSAWLGLPAYWLAANLLHHLWIETRRRLWERGIRRGADGLLADAAPYTVGRGDVAVLLVHGFADTPAVFRAFAKTLAAQGLTCRAMRLPGAGEPLAVAARQTVATWLASVRGEAAELRAKHRRVWLAGHSMGGALALLAQLDHPETADGLILLAPLIEVSPSRAPLLPPRAWFRIAQAAFPLSRTFESCFPANVLTHDAKTILYTRDRFIPFATYNILFQLTDRLRGRGAELRVPFYAALAALDPVVKTSDSQAWLATCQTQHRRIETLEGCGHAIPQETGLLPGICERIAAFIA